MSVVLGRHQSPVCPTRSGSTKQSTCEAWFALNRRAYQAVLNMAIQAEMNMQTGRQHGQITCGQELAAEFTSSVGNYSTLGSFADAVTSYAGRTTEIKQ